jgi:hypothetical protein
MRNEIQISRITSNNCGGKGAWIDNPLNTPSPGAGEWSGFQLGGGGGGNGRARKTRRKRKSSKTKKRRQIKRRRYY